MRNALGEPGTIVVFGGTSEIGIAVVREVIGLATRSVTLACRDVVAGESVAATLRHDAMRVEVMPFEASEPASAVRVIEQVRDSHGDIDLVVVAHGQLGESTVTTSDPVAAAALVATNTGGAIAAIVAAGNALRQQGHGDIVVLSSVAGERVRAANPVYGGSKSGLDGFAQGYGDLVAADGVHVLVVRPGYVHSRMTKGLDAAPFATTPERVARDTVAALRARRRMVWSPGILRLVFSVLRHVPGPIWRRLPLG